MTEPQHFTPLVPVQPEPAPSMGTEPQLEPVSSRKPGANRPSRFVRVGIVTGTAALVLVGAVTAMGASPAPSGSTTTPTTPSASGVPNAGGSDDDHMGGDRGGFGRGFDQISITAINGSNLSLATDDGWTRTITATSTTEITRNGATIAVSDLAVGDEIRFAQTRATDGTYSIDKIVVVMPSIGGEVTAKTADMITVTQRDGTTGTIHVDSATTYTVQGVASASLADITVGMHVRAEGTLNTDGSLDASSVQSGFGGHGGHGPGDHDGTDDDATDASPAATASPSATP